MPVAALLVLCYTFPDRKHIALYRHIGCEDRDIFTSIFGSSLEEIDAAFWQEMGRSSYDAALLEQMLRKEGH